MRDRCKQFYRNSIIRPKEPIADLRLALTELPTVTGLPAVTELPAVTVSPRQTSINKVVR
ncbi:MAG: hypothetical protein ACR2N1_25905 [Rubripirellula sp.]